MWDVLKTGKGELDLLYGKNNGLPPDAMNFFGRLHGSFKTVPKRAEFYRSIIKRTEHAEKMGIDTSDPMVEAKIAAEAYVDATRAIFMNDNAMTTAYRILLRYAENKGKGGQAAAATMKTLLPIVKVPANFVAESTSYAIGGAKALGKVIADGGTKNLTPEGADYVMRALKKQGIGAGLMAIGYLNADDIGGYYQQSDSRKPGDLKPGDLVLFGVKVPHFMLHTPALECLQIGATLARTQRMYATKHKGDPLAAAGAGALASTRGMVEQVPFLEQPVRSLEALRNPESATKYTGELAKSLIVPPDVQNIANYMDKQGDVTIPRKQDSITDYIQSGIPGAREALPVDRKKLIKLRMEDRANKAKGYAEGGMVADSTILPAVKFKNAIIPGKHEDHHSDILKSNGIGKRQPHVEGFSTPEGFKTRQEMSAYMKAQGYKDVPDEMHSQDMRKLIKEGKPIDSQPGKTKVSRRQSRKEMMDEA